MSQTMGTWPRLVRDCVDEMSQTMGTWPILVSDCAEMSQTARTWPRLGPYAWSTNNDFNGEIALTY